MALKLHNSITKDKQVFKPLKEGHVSLYVCGVTPQNSAHLGHGVSALRFATLRRFLEFRGYHVTYVENITDIDDKIIARTKELGMTAREIADKYSAEYRDGLRMLGVPDPTHNPRVTEYIPQIIEYVTELITKGYAYENGEGDVYFAVEKLPSYGELSNRKREFAEAGHRKATSENKRDEVDFALWKADVEHGWESPWGIGRPGWHIECSVMANSLLGNRIDIHGGGLDLLFPHHENECAQCQAHNNEKFVNVWMHSGLLNVNGTKMSKSLGNFITIPDAISRYGVQLINMVIARHQFRSVIDLTDKLFLENINMLLLWVRAIDSADGWQGISFDECKKRDSMTRLISDFVEVMEDDLNTPRALVKISPYLEGISSFDDAERPVIVATCVHLFRIMGLFVGDFDANIIIDDMIRFYNSTKGAQITRARIEDVLLQRNHARANRDYAESDRLRDELAEQGIKCIDNKDSLSWEFIV